MNSTRQQDWRTPGLVIVAGCLIAVLGFGARSTFGLYLEPMTTARGWSRETFSIALAIQNLMWGIGLPIAGAIADKFGAARVILFGAILYALGIYGMSVAETSSMLYVTAGVITGTGVAFTAFSLAMAAMARVTGPERRSLVLGLGTAAGSLGQVLFSPISQGFISSFGWQQALLMQAGFVMLLIPLALLLPGASSTKDATSDEQSLGGALSEAMSHRGSLCTFPLI